MHTSDKVQGFYFFLSFGRFISLDSYFVIIIINHITIDSLLRE